MLGRFLLDRAHHQRNTPDDQVFSDIEMGMADRFGIRIFRRELGRLPLHIGSRHAGIGSPPFYPHINGSMRFRPVQPQSSVGRQIDHDGSVAGKLTSGNGGDCNAATLRTCWRNNRFHLVHTIRCGKPASAAQSHGVFDWNPACIKVKGNSSRSIIRWPIDRNDPNRRASDGANSPLIDHGWLCNCCRPCRDRCHQQQDRYRKVWSRMHRVALPLSSFQAPLSGQWSIFTRCCWLFGYRRKSERIVWPVVRAFAKQYSSHGSRWNSIKSVPNRQQRTTTCRSLRNGARAQRRYHIEMLVLPKMMPANSSAQLLGVFRFERRERCGAGRRGFPHYRHVR